MNEQQILARRRSAGFAAFFFSGVCAISSGVVVSLLQEQYGFAYGVTGTLRTDSVTSCSTPTTLRLGHYALPVYDTPIQENVTELHGGLKAYTIYNGKHSLAFVPLKGWSQIEFIRTKGLHPETQFAKTINATADVSGPTELKALMLFKVGRFKPEEIQKSLDQL